MLAVHRTADGGGFAASGDSGSAVLGQTEDHGGLDFVGLLVSVLMIKSVLGHNIAPVLMIPAQRSLNISKPEQVSSGLQEVADDTNGEASCYFFLIESVELVRCGSRRFVA